MKREDLTDYLLMTFVVIAVAIIWYLSKTL